MLELPDILAHFDHLLGNARSVEGVFHSVSEAETFSKRLRDLRPALEKAATPEPTFDLIATAAFPGLAGDSLRVSFAKFAKQLAQVAEKSGSRIALVKPAGRNLASSEIRCHFEGTPLPRQKELKDMGQRS